MATRIILTKNEMLTSFEMNAPDSVSVPPENGFMVFGWNYVFLEAPDTDQYSVESQSDRQGPVRGRKLPSSRWTCCSQTTEDPKTPTHTD